MIYLLSLNCTSSLFDCTVFINELARLKNGCNPLLSYFVGNFVCGTSTVTTGFKFAVHVSPLHDLLLQTCPFTVGYKNINIENIFRKLWSIYMLVIITIFLWIYNGLVYKCVYIYMYIYIYIMFSTFTIFLQCNYSIFFSLLFFHFSKIYNNKMIVSHFLVKLRNFQEIYGAFSLY